MKLIYRFIYYAFCQFLPSHPFPGYQIAYSCRRFLVSKLAKSVGKDIIVKSKVYFGKGDRLSIGDYSHLGESSTLGGDITIGKYVQMGPDVVMMSASHAHDRTDIPIMFQGQSESKPIFIGDGVWIGTRAVIMPGVTIGPHSIIGANAVVTKSFEPFSVIGGVPAKLIRKRE